MSAIRKIINLIIIVLLLIFSVTIVKSQTYSKEIKSAEKAFLEARYKDAADFYDIAAKMVENPGKEHLELYYMLGYCAMRTTDYRKAMTNFARYLNLSKRFSVNLKQLSQVKEWNDWCAIELTVMMERDLPSSIDKNIKISNLTAANSAHNDIGAILIENNTKLLLSSNRLTEQNKKLEEINDDIYVSQFKKNSISEPLKIQADFNDSKNEVSSAYHEESKTLYFTVYDDNNETADIYMCKKINDHWADPEKLPATINSKSWDGHPSISKNGKILYFSSNRPGGQGGKDIYFSIRQDNGSWSEAKNIGFQINTRYDEITPCIDSTGTKIYFSSNGHMGLGGFDIFYSTFDASNLWGDPQMLLSPINSESDDIYYVLTSYPGTSLFSSNRKGGKGIFDIYLAEVSVKTPEKKPDIPIAETPKANEEKLTITDKPQKAETEDVKPVAVETKKEPVVAEKPKETPVVKETPKTEQKTTQVIVDKPVQKTAPPEKSKTEPPAKTTPTAPESNSQTGISDLQLLNAEITGLYFKVQLGAFKNHITVNHTFFTSKLDPTNITEEQWPPDPLYKYTIGQYQTIASAAEFKKEMRTKGYTDAFLTCYYNQNRISMDEAKELIKKYYKVVSYR